MQFYTNSCHKDDDPVITPVAYTPYDFSGSYLTAAGFNGITAVPADNNYAEVRLFFKSLTNGNITDITIKIPGDETVRVTLWDYHSYTKLRETTILSDSDVPVTIPVSSWNLLAGKNYVLSMNSDACYARFHNPGGDAAPYPLSVSDFKFTAFAGHGGTSQVIPDVYDQTIYFGDFSFTFKRSS